MAAYLSQLREEAVISINLQILGVGQLPLATFEYLT